MLHKSSLTMLRLTSHDITLHHMTSLTTIYFSLGGTVEVIGVKAMTIFAVIVTMELQ